RAIEVMIAHPILPPPTSPERQKTSPPSDNSATSVVPPPTSTTIDPVGSVTELLARGSERGYVTYDELSATVPLDQLSSEEIEDTMTMISDLGITVTESDESEEPVA